MTPDQERLMTVARRALRRYQDFGELALEAWDREDLGTAYNLLVRRDRAFLNFRALDARAQYEGVEINSDRELLAIYAKVAKLNSAIQERLAAEQQRLSNKCVNARRATQGLQAYANHARASGRALQRRRLSS